MMSSTYNVILAEAEGRLMRLCDSSHDGFTRTWARSVNHMPCFHVRLSQMTPHRMWSELLTDDLKVYATNHLMWHHLWSLKQRKVYSKSPAHFTHNLLVQTESLTQDFLQGLDLDLAFPLKTLGSYKTLALFHLLSRLWFAFSYFGVVVFLPCRGLACSYIPLTYWIFNSLLYSAVAAAAS